MIKEFGELSTQADVVGSETEPTVKQLPVNEGILPPSPEQQLAEVLKSQEVNSKALEAVTGSLVRDQGDYAQARERLGLPPSEEIPISVQADQARIAELENENKRLEAEAASLRRMETSKRWVQPIPTVEEKAPEGSAYAGHTFFRFSPEQRAQIAQDATLYEGVRFNIGDRVFAMNGEAEVMRFEPGGEIISDIDYGADASGRIWREKIQPPKLLLRSIASKEMFTVTAGETEVRRMGS